MLLDKPYKQSKTLYVENLLETSELSRYNGTRNGSRQTRLVQEFDKKNFSLFCVTKVERKIS